MHQPSPVPAPPVVERFGPDARRRALGIGFALLVEALLLLLLLTLGTKAPPGADERRIRVVSIRTEAIPADTETGEPDRPRQAEERPASEDVPPVAQPLPEVPVEPQAAPVPPVMPPPPLELPPSAATPPSLPRPGPTARAPYGPPDRGGSSASRDTERVGTAPNGEPLYAAAWYREPAREMLRSYLSTARGPGWGLIACRTAPDYRVEDCVALDEYPSGSQINRAVLAAAWEFRVRPPQRGGRPLVGSWVRIRIDYAIERR